MKKNLTLPAVIVMLILVSCQSADKKIPQIAGDFCNCFSSLEKNLSEKTKGIIDRAANSANPEQSMKDDVEKLTEEEKMSVGTEMVSLGDMENKDSDLGKCMEAVKNKYNNARTFNEKKFLEKMVKELDSRGGCSFTADLLQIGLKTKD